MRPPDVVPSPVSKDVFVGHGRSEAWRELAIFLYRIGLNPLEFNSISTAGVQVQERLSQMLEQARFAFIVLTGEDESTDGNKHARENAIHELGLFQGKLGFMKAIAMLEDGCVEFSNIAGLGQIRFAKGAISGAFEQIRAVLEREGIITSSEVK